ncbi:hypothetical protein J6590_018755 [Homalodisca vitripennis]|nr:hypothetical protein J6590_018755 [Homalodisca vitripennis]
MCRYFLDGEIKAVSPTSWIKIEYFPVTITGVLSTRLIVAYMLMASLLFSRKLSAKPRVTCLVKLVTSIVEYTKGPVVFPLPSKAPEIIKQTSVPEKAALAHPHTCSPAYLSSLC